MIDTLLTCDSERIGQLNPREIKTALAACVQLGSEFLLHNLIQRFHAAKKLDTETFYMAVHLTVVHKSPKLVESITSDLKTFGFTTDMESMNNAIGVLTQSGEVKTHKFMCLFYY